MSGIKSRVILLCSYVALYAYKNITPKNKFRGIHSKKIECSRKNEEEQEYQRLLEEEEETDDKEKVDGGAVIIIDDVEEEEHRIIF
eukprot:1490394-Ditylum_brightwellii.AAC.1